MKRPMNRAMVAAFTSAMAMALSCMPIHAEGPQTSPCEVTAQRAASFTTHVPKSVPMTVDASGNGTASYEVYAEGTIGTGHTVNIRPDASFVMSEEGGGGTVTAAITQDKTSFDATDLADGNRGSGTITGNGFGVGTYKGTFNFTISYN